MACLLHRLNQAPTLGPYGAPRTGQRAEPVAHFPAFGDLSEEDRAAVNRVWAGEEKHALVLDAQGHAHLAVARPSGKPIGGRRYGYVVRTVALAARPAPPARRQRGRGRLALLLLVAAPLLLAGALLLGWALHPAGATPAPPVRPAAPPVEPAPAGLREELARARAERDRLAAEAERLHVALDALSARLKSALAGPGGPR